MAQMRYDLPHYEGLGPDQTLGVDKRQTSSQKCVATHQYFGRSGYIWYRFQRDTFFRYQTD